MQGEKITFALTVQKIGEGYMSKMREDHGIAAWQEGSYLLESILK